MTKKGKRPVFLVDNDIRFSEFKENYHKKAKFYSTVGLMGQSNAEDPEIFAKCSSLNIHIITGNSGDFIPQQIHDPTSKIGIVGIGSHTEESIKTFGKVLKELPEHGDYINKYISVTSKGYTIKKRTT